MGIWGERRGLSQPCRQRGVGACDTAVGWLVRWWPVLIALIHSFLSGTSSAVRHFPRLALSVAGLCPDFESAGVWRVAVRAAGQLRFVHFGRLLALGAARSGAGDNPFKRGLWKFPTTWSGNVC